jgi:hypothetical protein
VVLSRRQLYALLVAGAVLTALIAALIAWRVWSSPSGPGLGQEPIAAAAILEPEQHLFADAVRARLELVVDRNRVDIDSIEVGANFDPYRSLRPTRRTETESGSITRISYDYVLGCLTAACLPKGNGKVELPGLALQFKTKNDPQLQTATVEWQPLHVGGRIDPRLLGEAALRAELRDLPAATYRVPPKTVQLIALLLAVLCFVGAAVLAIRFLPLDRMVAWLGRNRADRRSPLERALALVRESTAKGEPGEGRQALERLAHELRDTREPELAGDAGRLAWSKQPPADSSVGPLSDDVERVIAEER